MNAHIDVSGITAHRATPIAQAQQHVDALRESLAGSPLPLAPEQARLLQAQAQEALETVVIACRLADWLERQVGHGAAADQDGQTSQAIESFFGWLRPGDPAPVCERQSDENAEKVRGRIAEVDETVRAMAGVLADSRGPMLAAVALRDARRVEAIVGAVMQSVGELACRAAALSGSVTEASQESG